MTININRHQFISFVKSGIRIAGYVVVMNFVGHDLQAIWTGFALLIGAEFLGIVEELGQSYGN